MKPKKTIFEANSRSSNDDGDKEVIIKGGLPIKVKRKDIEEGIKEEEKNRMVKKIHDKQKMNMLIEESKPLYKIKTTWPFDLFPSSLIIEKNKIDIVHKSFFYTQQAFPILIKNIKAIIIENTPFFATLKFDVELGKDPDPLRFLKKKEATRARRIIHGLVACENEGIDMGNFSSKELIEKVEEIGRIQSG